MDAILGVELQDIMKISTWLNEETDDYGHLFTSDLAIEVRLTNSDGQQLSIEYQDAENGFALCVPSHGY